MNTPNGIKGYNGIKNLIGIKGTKGVMGVMAKLAIAAFTTAVLAAPPPQPPPQPQPENGIRKISVPCPMCAKSKEGRGRLKLHPPDHGQHTGSIYSDDHWDVRLACPQCEGKGRRTVYRLEMSKTLEDVPPCPKCGWTGVEKCRKCKATGLVPCKARECKGGWIIRKNEIGSGKRNRHYKMSVEPCPTCKGIGKVICPHCRGLEGTPCRKCHGLGKKVR